MDANQQSGSQDPDHTLGEGPSIQEHPVFARVAMLFGKQAVFQEPIVSRVSSRATPDAQSSSILGQLIIMILSTWKTEAQAKSVIGNLAESIRTPFETQGTVSPFFQLLGGFDEYVTRALTG